MADADLVAFLAGFAVLWGGLGVYFLWLVRRVLALEREVSRREPRR